MMTKHCDDWRGANIISIARRPVDVARGRLGVARVRTLAEQRHTQAEAARILGTSKSAISHFAAKHKIAFVTLRDRQKDTDKDMEDE